MEETLAEILKVVKGMSNVLVLVGGCVTALTIRALFYPKE